MLIDNCRYSNTTSWEQARFMAYWAGNSGRMRKSTKIEDLVPLAVDEKFKGSTEVDENALRWWKSLKKKKEGD